MMSCSSRFTLAVFVCLAWGCSRGAEPDAATAADDPPPLLIEAETPPAEAASPPPKFTPLPEKFIAKLALHHATVALPPNYRVEANGPGRRVDFIARPPDGEFALLYDFGAEPSDSSELEPILTQVASAFTHNYARDNEKVGETSTLSPELAKQLGGHQLLRTCFVPARFLGDEFCCGVSFTLFRRDIGLMMLLVLTNDHTACIDEISTIEPTLHGFAFAP